MQIKRPKNNEKYYWTDHVYGKMVQYGISEQTVRRIIRNPERVEEGIAEDTIAVMQTRGNKQSYELWVMYASPKISEKSNKLSKVTVITVWRYPGISPVRDIVPIPQDIVDELNIIL